MSAATDIWPVVLLVLVLAAAIVRLPRVHEAAVALPAAAVCVASGGLSAAAAGDELRRLGPVVAFLAAVLVVSHVCERDGVFRAAGALLAGAGAGSGRRLLGLVFALAALTTAALSLDATVVLLTPVVFATAARLSLPPRPHVYACTHLANAASLLLPVSNLTNLLAVGAAGASFGRFAALMALPWLVVVLIEYAVFRVYFAGDLAHAGAAPPAPAERPGVPVATLAVLGLMLVGFFLASFAGVDVAWVAAAAAAALAVPALARGRVRVPTLVAAADPAFLVFVLSLSIVVLTAVHHGVGHLVNRLLPGGASLAALVGVAALAALLANLVNNLPATLIMLPQLSGGGLGPLLAMLVGVNVGPNLTYVGSLATLLWRRIARDHDHDVPLGEFTALGLIATPLAIVAAVVMIWMELRLTGGG
ncbi:MAG: ArsB/NhaD family transporter [Thermoleophilia bacterium]